MTAFFLSWLLWWSAPAQPPLSGAWQYEWIHVRGGQRVPLTGIFLFHEGRFAQQAIHEGSRVEDRLGQAHGGTYTQDEDRLKLLARWGIVVHPGEISPPLESRNETAHDLQVELRGDDLTLTFGSGTVQKLRRLEEGEIQWIELEQGLLGLAGSHFVLVAQPGAQEVAAGSGTYRREDSRLVLEAWRWFELVDGRVHYSRDRTIRAHWEGPRLVFDSGLQLTRK